MASKYGNALSTLLKRWFIDGLSAMAQGLFVSLVTGAVLSQLFALTGILAIERVANLLSDSSPVIGAAIGAAIAYKLYFSQYTAITSAATGAIGYGLAGPLGAYIAVILAGELSNLVAGKTKADIILMPLINLTVGGIAAVLIAPYIGAVTNWLGSVINSAASMHPLPMGVIISLLMGILAVAPFSAAAITVAIGLSGIAAGAATIGCCTSMIGFAVMSYKENKLTGLLLQGLGTSKFQFPNILKKPVIWLPPIITSIILGPISTCLVKMENTPVGAGSGSMALLGQIGTYYAMRGSNQDAVIIIIIILFQFILPAVLVYLIYSLLKKAGWIKPGDLKLNI